MSMCYENVCTLFKYLPPMKKSALYEMSVFYEKVGSVLIKYRHTIELSTLYEKVDAL
jgi:hypothetical protein